MVNVWVQSANGQSARADQISSLAVRKIDRKGWCVVWQRPRSGDVILAALGRGGKARDGAERACHELADAAVPARPIPVAGPDDLRARRRGTGTG